MGTGKRRLNPISSSLQCSLVQVPANGEPAKTTSDGSRSRSRLEQQFGLFARWDDDNLDSLPRFGHFNSQTRAQSDLITLSQSDKWLRQAKVIDGWNVTTTDTAIAFRKISRGSTRLSYPGWLVFLRELAETKRLPLPQMWATLEQVDLS